MADIQIVYRVGYCAHHNDEEYSYTCHTSYAKDFSGCRGFSYGDNKGGVEFTVDGKPFSFVPYGDCAYAKYIYKYKGWTGKRYEIEPYENNFSPELDCMIVTIGNKQYDCVKVILDGKCIYNILDDKQEQT